MKVIGCTLLCFFFSFVSAGIHPGKIKNDSTRAMIFSARASLILNRSFSHQVHNVEQESSGNRSGSEPLSSAGIMPGYEIAANALMNTGKDYNFFLETSYSFTQGRYRYLFSGTTDAEGPVYAGTSTDITCEVKAHLLNLGAGLRWTLPKGFLFAAQLNFNYGISVLVHEKGPRRDVTWTNYPAVPGAPPNTTLTTVSTIDTKRSVPTRAFSFRLSAGYEFKEKDAGILAFRNMGIDWQLPWWGLGYYKNF